MDYIWTPWRYQYVKDANRKSRCVFCDIAASNEDETNLVLHRAQSNYVVLNRFPYTSGHAMVIPYQHVATLEETPAEALAEMMTLTRRLEAMIRKIYQPSGVNIGMNIGEAAGAGVAGHIHMHILPRWIADSNFMTVVGETRILPEDLTETWQRLRNGFETKPGEGLAF
jgi:ATP adenylyltransferase